MEYVSYENFASLDIRCGQIISARINTKAKKPAYVLEVDFGSHIGIKTTSAQITINYTLEQLIGKKVIAVVNFFPKKVADVVSEVLILGTIDQHDVLLLEPDSRADIGSRIG